VELAAQQKEVLASVLVKLIENKEGKGQGFALVGSNRAKGLVPLLSLNVEDVELTYTEGLAVSMVIDKLWDNDV
jgi:hypothetical protein